MPRQDHLNDPGQGHAVVFRVDGHRYALPLACVERVVRAVEVTPLPGAPASVLGVIDVEGRVLPVLDVRRRFGRPAREIDPADHFLIGRTPARTVVLAIDQADEVIDAPPAAIDQFEDIAAGNDQVRGVIRLEDGLVLIHDLEGVFTASESHALDDALKTADDDAVC